MYLISLIIFRVSLEVIVRGCEEECTTATDAGDVKAASLLQFPRTQQGTMNDPREKQPPPSKTSPDNCFANYIRSPSCSKSFPGLESVFGKSLELLPPVDLLANKASSCAVVSSSSRMLAHSHGHDIDQHDIVIRFNDAAVEGFEKHVGSKTDILVFNDQLARQRRTLASLPLHAAPATVWRSWHKTFPFEGTFRGLENYVAYRRDFPNSTHYLLNFRFYEFVEQMLNSDGGTASTGLIGVALALQLCDSVDVYEIAPSSALEQGNHYYLMSLPAHIESNACTCIAIDMVEGVSYEEAKVALSVSGQHTDYCPHNCALEHAFLMEHNTLPEDVVNREGVVRLSATNEPKLQFCK